MSTFATVMSSSRPRNCSVFSSIASLTILTGMERLLVVALKVRVMSILI